MIAYQKDNAWLFIGFAGTTLSVVLSILAIFITFIDIAGQQKKLSDITDTANELKFSLKQFIKESQKFYENTKRNPNFNNRNSNHGAIVTEDSVEYNSSNKNDVKDDKNDKKRLYSEPVGMVGNFKVKKYDITIEDIKAIAEATKVKYKVNENDDLYWYNIEYSGNYKDGAEPKKFKELVSETATIID